MRTPLPRGRDVNGVVHYDSEAKQSYIWPMCSTPYTDIRRVDPTQPVTCLRCLWRTWYLEHHEDW